MITAQKININGLELDSSQELTPRTICFFDSLNLKVSRLESQVTLEPKDGEGFRITPATSEKYQDFKANKDDYLARNNLSI